MEYVFAECRLCPERRELRHREESVHLQPLVYDLLLYLIQHRDRVIPRSELRDHVWGGAVVSAAAITSAIRDARAATGDDGRQQRVIRTLPRQGFRFVCPVTETPSTEASPTGAEGVAGLPDELQRCEALIELGEQYASSGRYHHGGRELFVRAAMLARRRKWPELLARAALGVGHLGHGIAVGDDLLIALLEEALATLDPHHASLRGRLRARLDVERRTFAPGTLQEASAHGGDPAVLGPTLLSRILHHSGPGHLGSRRRWAEDLLSVASASGDVTLESWGHHFRISCALESGDLASLDRAVARFASATERNAGSPHVELLTSFEAGRAMWEGRFASADVLMRRFSELARRSPLDLIATHAQILRLFLATVRGETVEPERWRALARAKVPPEFAIVPPCIAAWVALELDHREEARSLYLDLVDEEIPDNMFTLTVSSLLGTMAARFGDAPRLRVFWDRLYPYGDQVSAAVCMHYVGSVWRPLGNIANARGRRAEAIELLRRAVATESRMGARALETHAKLDLARVLAEAGESADARTQLEGCLQQSRELGMRRLHARAARLAASLEDPRSRLVPRPPYV